MFSNKYIEVCAYCNFGFLDEYIDQQRLNAFYSKEYRGKGNVHRKKLLSLPSIPNRAISQWMLINLFHPLEKVNNVLDVGAGYGYTFDVAKYIINPDTITTFYSFEPDKHAQKYLLKKNINIYDEVFTKDTNINEKFDIIIMSHVLEHYNGYDIISVLKKINSVLNYGGIALIEVPHNNLEKIKTLRRNDAPHLSFFSVEALTSALEYSGLHMLYINTCGELTKKYYVKKDYSSNLISKILKKIKRYYFFIRKFVNFDILNILSYNQYFKYGEDRIWIRAIVTKLERI